MPASSVSNPQSSRSGQSRIQRPVSYHEKHARPDPPNLKPHPDAPRGDRSPTRLPISSKSSFGPKNDAPTQRRVLRPPKGYNEPAKARTVPLAAAENPPKPTGADETKKSTSDACGSSDIVKTESALEAESCTSKEGPWVQDDSASVSPPQEAQEPKTSTRTPAVTRQMSVGLQRSQSLRKPTPSASSRPPDVRTHSRHASTTSTVASGRSSRVTSSEVRGGRQDHNNDASSKDRVLRSASTTQGVKRSVSTRMKTEQPNSSVTSSAHVKDNKTSSSTTTAKRDISGGTAPQLNRPAFSTMQQHFSPRKTTKAATSTFIHPNASDTPAPQSTETTRLQTELLHLSILHEASLLTSTRYNASAHAALENKFNAVARQHQAMRVNERKMQERLNLLALSEWTSGSTSFGLSENIHLLSSILKELPPLTDAGGRFPRLVETFETWIAQVGDVWAARDKEGGEDNHSSKFIDGLSEDWSTENASLTRRLTALARESEMLMPAKEGSSVATLVVGCKRLLRGTLDELVAMTKIEKDVMAREKAWVQEKIESINFEELV